MNDLIIKRTSDDVYNFSVSTGSNRWHFSIHNNLTIKITGVWVRAGSCGSVPIKTDDDREIWKAVLSKLSGEYKRVIASDGRKI